MKYGQVHLLFKKATEQGMTLLEMIVGLLIFSLIILGLSRLYYFVNTNMAHGINTEQLLHQEQVAMIWLQRDVQQAAITTAYDYYDFGVSGPSGSQTAPITTSASGDGFIVYQNQPSQWVYYHLTTWQDGQLQRYSVTQNLDGTFPVTYQVTTLLTGVSCTQTPFTVSTYDKDNVHQSLTIATLTIQVQHAVEPGTKPDAIVQPITTFTVQGNAELKNANQGGF